MLNKCWADNYCKYFANAVLPLDPILEVSLLGYETPLQDICAICNKLYISDGKQYYCSAACKTEGNRRKNRERMRKKRHKT